MALPFVFANVTTLVTSQLDANYNALGALTPVPCTAAGTNTITLTPNANTPTITAYSNYMQFTYIAPAANTSAAQAQVGSIPLLNVYKDQPTGAALLTGGEIQAGFVVTLIYDSALNSGNGGFHLVATGNSVKITGSTITGPIFFGATGNSGITYQCSTATSVAWANIPAASASIATILAPGSSVGDCVLIGTPASVPTGVDFFGWVNNAGTVTLEAINNTASSITPISGTYRVTAQRFSP